jgi:hypothetical protein
MYIQNLPFGAVANDYTMYSSVNHGSFLLEDPKTFPFYSWDNYKTRGCYCDPEYGDVDCSKRMCQYGTDIMDQRCNMNAQQKYQVQKIVFTTDSMTSVSGTAAPGSQGKTFALMFKSKLNESFTTLPIPYFTFDTDFHQFMLNIQVALESLPNKVIDKVEVHGDYLNSDAFTTIVNITFVGDNVQGPQHPITVKDIECGDGCTPKLSGLDMRPDTQNVSEVTASDFNSYECGRRGKCDYTTGLCTCFAGYTGLSCNVITSLV